MTKSTMYSTVSLKEVPIPILQVDEPSRPNVIVVDSDSGIAGSLVETLSRRGYATVAASDADSALELALVRPPEILITEVMLPGMNGIDLAIRIRRIYPDCAIFLISGHASSNKMLAHATRAGHEFVLLDKPVDPLELLARISKSRRDLM